MKSKQAIRPLDEEEEMYDTFIIEDPVEVELKQTIRNFLISKDNKLNQISMSKDPFFDLIENKVNYTFDVFIVPHIKNIIRHYPVTKDNQIDYFNTKNNLTPEISRYLYLRKFKLQKEKDEHESIMKTALNDQNIQNEIQQYKERLMSREHSSKAMSNLEIKQYEKETIMPKIDISGFDLEDFFINKYIRYEHTEIASDTNKDFILHKFHDMSFQKYYRRHEPKIISKLI